MMNMQRYGHRFIFVHCLWTFANNSRAQRDAPISNLTVQGVPEIHGDESLFEQNLHAIEKYQTF